MNLHTERSLDPKNYPQLGEDATILIDGLRSALSALESIRTHAWELNGERDPGTLRDLEVAIAEVTLSLSPRIDGLGRSLVRQFVEAGGSYGELARTMHTSRATAQSRAQTIISKSPDVWEIWAEGDTTNPAPLHEQDEVPDSSLPDNLVSRWGDKAVRALLRPTAVLAPKRGGWIVQPGNDWDPLTAEDVWVDGADTDGPEEARLLFRIADGRWIIRDPHITTPYRRMRFYWANDGEALRFLESVDATPHTIDRYFPAAGQIDPLE